MTMSYLTVYAGNFKRTGRYVQYSEFQYLFIFSSKTVSYICHLSNSKQITDMAWHLAKAFYFTHMFSCTGMLFTFV